MKRSSVLVGAVVVSASLAACSSGSSADTGTGDGSAATRFAVASDPGVLNPITNATGDGQQLALLAYESLVRLPAGAAAEGLLATDWEVTPTSATFTLSPDATCSSGEPLTASDVKATFDYAADPATGSPFLDVYVPSEGMTVTADDDAGVVTFAFATPLSFPLETVGQLPIVCADGLADPTTLDTTTAGTGPYVLDTADAGLSYTYTLRDDYGSPTEGMPATLEVEVVADDTTAANMLTTGDLDIVQIGGTDRDRLSGEDLTTVDVSAGPGRLFFNQAPGRATHDLAVREAIAQAIDRDAVGSVSTGGRGQAMTSLMSNSSSVCVGEDNAASIPAHDPAAAETVLADAGITLKLLYNSAGGPGITAGVELIQEELAAVGVTVELTPSASYTDVIFSGGDWDLVWAPISAELPSIWAGILSGDFPPDGGNWTYNANTAYQAAVAEAQQLSGEDSCGAWSAAEAALFANVDVLPLWEDTETFFGSGVELGVNSNGQLLPTTLRVG
ncbi:ABC transporter substrate-binding protein [Cellulomonas soli]|uniref:ABC transporter substrate-binding protein n=1 Tax=Cellulomonas soli TaxID=931535 RepID=UPI003F83BFBB